MKLLDELRLIIKTDRPCDQDEEIEQRIEEVEALLTEVTEAIQTLQAQRYPGYSLEIQHP